MLGILTTLLSLLSPLLGTLIKRILERGQVDAEAKKRLEQAYIALSELHRSDIQKTKALEKRLGKEHEKMDEIQKSGKWPWQP